MALEMIDEFGSIGAYAWSWADFDRPAPQSFAELPAVTDASTGLSKDLKRRGWRFVGPTTMYAFMQAMGLVNDHLVECERRGPCEESRAAIAAKFVRS
jgi:DNA-3-methyladenine glycosylase I